MAPAAGLAISACSRPADPPLLSEAPDGNDGSETFGVQQLQALLDRRAEAQLSGDEEAYLADLDPSDSELIDRERLEFANLQQFEVEDIRYVTGQIGTPPATGDQSAPHRFVPVTKVVKLTADAGPVGVLGPGYSFEYEVDLRDGEWAVTDILPLDQAEVERRLDEGLHARRGVLPADAPWLHDELRVLNVGNVWLVADESVTDLEDYAAEAEVEAQRVEAVWGDRPRYPGHVLFFTRDEETFARWYSVGLHMENVGFRKGFAIPLRGVRGNGEIYTGQHAGARNLIFLPSLEEQGWGPTLTMRHELTHTTTRRAYGTGDGLMTSPPTWAVEGFANYIMVRGDNALEQGQRERAVNGFTGSLPDSHTFQDVETQDVSSNYAVSYTVFRFIEQVRDFETSIEFYAEAIKWDDAPLFGSDHYDPFVATPAFDGLCQRVLGLGSDAFLDQWASFVRAGA